MGVFEGNRPIYYREASVFVQGRYNREVSIDKIMAIKKEYVQKYGHRLNKIDIVYNSKKKGIVATAYFLSEEEADSRLSLNDRPAWHRTKVMYGRSKELEPYVTDVNNSDYGF